MTCQHRWIPSKFGFKYVPPNTYLYECKRCGATAFAALKENTFERKK